MLVSYNWLQSYFEKEIPKPEELVELLSIRAFEIESLEKIKDDFVIDVDVLPNRAHDCLSHDGLAREISVITKIPLKPKKEFSSGEGGETNLKIEIQSSGCNRYIGKIIKNIKVKESPDWLKEKLEILNQKTINNIVDSTNYVMLKTGQPLHAFDLDKVEGGIIVRLAKEGEKMITLDGKEIELTSEDLIIADGEGVLALAGIKGGKKAEIDENTKNIILESAHFDPVSVRKSSRRHGIFTDSSKRFENEPSPEMTFIAMQQVADLISGLSDSTSVEKEVDETDWDFKPKIIDLNILDIEPILGISVEKEEVVRILENLGFVINSGSQILSLQVPFYRLDVKNKEDVIEEIGRIYGYEKIPAKLPSKTEVSKQNKEFNYITKIRNKFIEKGFSEVYTYSFTNKGEVEVDNAIASDKNFLRNSLKEGVLDSLNKNILNKDLLGLDKVRIFEVGRVFKDGEEKISLCIGIEKVGKKDNVSEELEKVFREVLGKDVSVGENVVWEEFLEIPDSVEDFDLKLSSVQKKFEPISIYPFVVRDIAVWIPEETEREELLGVIKENAGDLLIKEPKLIDEYKKEGKVSLAHRLVFQSFEKTLTDKEVNEFMEKISSEIEKKGWQVR